MGRRESWRKAGERVAELRKKAIEEAAIGVVEEVVEQLIKFLPLSVLMWDRAIDRLAEKGIVDPTDDDILEVMEELADEINVYESFKSAPKSVKSAICVAMKIAKRLGKREWFERLTYEEVLKRAKKRGMNELTEYLVKYPRLCEKLIDWVRECLMMS